MRNWYDHSGTKGCYSSGTTVNPVVGFSSLNTKADNRTLSVMRDFFVRCKPCCAQIMVGRSGETFASAGFFGASLLTLLRPATLFSSGEVRLEKPTKEATDMVTTPTPLYPQYIWIIAAVRRDIPKITAQIHHIAACSEREARRSLVRENVCFFMGRIRQEVRHA